MCTYSDTLYAKKCTFFVLGVNSDTPYMENAPFCVQFFLERRSIRGYRLLDDASRREEEDEKI